MATKKYVSASILTLFTSSATLLCCALPATLSVIAGAAAVSTLFSIFPWIIPLSYYKDWLFIIAAVALIINGYFLYRPSRVCPIEEKENCERAMRVSKIIFWFSVALVLIGFFFAYLLTPLLFALGIWK